MSIPRRKYLTDKQRADNKRASKYTYYIRNKKAINERRRAKSVQIREEKEINEIRLKREMSDETNKRMNEIKNLHINKTRHLCDCKNIAGVMSEVLVNRHGYCTYCGHTAVVAPLQHQFDTSITTLDFGNIWKLQSEFYQAGYREKITSKRVTKDRNVR